jgi:hypothetical protein
MSGETRNERALEQVVREAKEDFAPKRDLDWDAMEARLMERVAQERNVLADEARASGARAGVLRIGAAVLAAAAAVAIVVRDRDTSVLGNAPSAAVDVSAGSLRATEGTGEVRIGGVPAAPGQALRPGDVVEADGARAVLERPRKVSWLIEREGGVARARVKSAGESLVLGLEDGAIEAQVTPVPTGEAFAVDVGTQSNVVRIAVHGTHLRVARAGSRVTVDLSEGVVSIGPAPRVGSTYGTLVTAPAHVELDANDVAHTLKIDHAASSVRPPIQLGGHDHVAVAPPPVAAPPQPQGAKPTPAPAAKQPPAAAETAAKPEPPKAAPLPPREALAAAVRDCATSGKKPGEVKVTVNSTLRIKIGATGEIERATFDPPLLPEIQTCAAAAIYKIKVDEPNGSMTVPIEFSY